MRLQAFAENSIQLIFWQGVSRLTLKVEVFNELALAGEAEGLLRG
jgi:hypothetical protein